MKKFIFFLTILILNNSGFAAAILGEEPRNNCLYSLEGCLFSTTFLPTALILDGNEVSDDDAMTQLADEVTGEVDSTEMIDKMAVHFETTAHEVVSAASDLLATEEGLSFEGLKQELK